MLSTSHLAFFVGKPGLTAFSFNEYYFLILVYHCEENEARVSGIFCQWFMANAGFVGFRNASSTTDSSDWVPLVPDLHVGLSEAGRFNPHCA